MPQVITEGSTIVCLHQGQVRTPAGQSKLKVGGALVLVDGDLNAASVSACINIPPPPGRVPCSTVTPNPGGTANRLKVEGRAALLQTFTGLTNSTPPGSCSVQDAGHTRLQAV